MTSQPYTPETFAQALKEQRDKLRQAREARRSRWGFPADYASILALLDCLPSRDELAPHTVPQAPPPKSPRRKGEEALHGEAARRRNCRLTRERYHRQTPEQRAERNRKRRARYREARASILARATTSD